MTITECTTAKGWEYEIEDQNGNIVKVVSNFVVGMGQLVQLVKSLRSMATTIWFFIISLLA